MSSEEAGKLVKRFYALQEERVETYRLFEEGFQAYLIGAPHYNFPMYRQLVHEITETFRKISAEILDIRLKLENEHKRKDVGTYMTQVQEEEEQKLDLTAKLQIATQNMVDHPDSECYQQEVKDFKQSLRLSVDKINEHLEELKYEAEDLLTA